MYFNLIFYILLLFVLFCFYITCVHPFCNVSINGGPQGKINEMKFRKKLEYSTLRCSTAEQRNFFQRRFPSCINVIIINNEFVLGLLRLKTKKTQTVID